MEQDRLNRIEEDIKELYRRMDNSTDRQARTETKLDILIQSVNEMKANLLKLSEKPIQRWESLITTAITAITTSGIGIIIGLIVGSKK